jgi:hypothetical protein
VRVRAEVWSAVPTNKGVSANHQRKGGGEKHGIDFLHSTSYRHSDFRLSLIKIETITSIMKPFRVWDFVLATLADKYMIICISLSLPTHSTFIEVRDYVLVISKFLSQ